MNSMYQSFRTSPRSALAILRSQDSQQVSYVPFRSDYYVDDDDDYEQYDHRPRRADNYYGIRQEYLRSFVFTREDSRKPDKLKRRIKAMAWAVICCEYKPLHAKVFRKKLSSKISRFFHDSTDLLSASCRKMNVPNCVRFSSLELD